MEKLPFGANFKRTKILWELGLHIAGDPATRYGGDRDMRITVGSGGGDAFKPWINLATGSAIMAYDVAKGAVDMAFVNPSALLTQAYRGTGLFTRPLPLRIIASYPSVDRFVIAMRKGLGFKSLHDVKAARYPLRVSLREDPTHSTLVLVSQLLAHYGMSVADIESWGGAIVPAGPPNDKRRMAGVFDGTLDAVFDEGISLWLDDALANGMELLPLEADAFETLSRIGWRKVQLKTGRFAHLPSYEAVDFSGWPLYARADLPDDVAYKICGAFRARHEYMPWEEGTAEGVDDIGRETPATPMDVPLHPGAERWYREHGLI
ncbi:MAG: TAXI family TRAP transporter solute-binding subunit [Beijerinckiaceae bacterium]